LFFTGKIVAVQQTEHPGKVTPPHVLLHREHQGEFVTERTKGFWTKLAVVSWIVSHLPILSAQFSYLECSVCKLDYVHGFIQIINCVK
jgi:hypothetical protein